MPSKIEPGQKEYALTLMLEQNKGQREIERQTGLSRPYLRKIAKEIGYKFPINGIDIVGKASMCANCGMIFRRPPSRIVRANNHFCDRDCKEAYMTGPNHPSWKNGKTANSFSSWIKNQAKYKEWKEAVLERDGYKCVISGRTEGIHCHHVYPKQFYPEMALKVANGISIADSIHREIHELIREGTDFDEAIQLLKEKYKNERDTGVKSENV